MIEVNSSPDYTVCKKNEKANLSKGRDAKSWVYRYASDNDRQAAEHTKRTSPDCLTWLYISRVFLIKWLDRFSKTLFASVAQTR